MQVHFNSLELGVYSVDSYTSVIFAGDVEFHGVHATAHASVSGSDAANVYIQ